MLEFLNIQKLYKRLHTTSDKALVKKIKRKTNNNGDGMDEKPFAEKLLSEDLNNEKNVPADKSEKTISAPVKKLKKEKDLLKDALQDLESELQSLRTVRAQMERKIKSASRELGNTQRQELELQGKIGALKQKENLLVKKSVATKEKLDALIKKMEKIKTLERQLQD